MTAKEALLKLWGFIYKKDYSEAMNYFNIIKQALNELEEYKKSDISKEEVCQALSEYLGEEIIYIGYDFISIDRTRIAVQSNLKNKNIEIYTELPPRLITMIGQFFESEVNKNEIS